MMVVKPALKPDLMASSHLTIWNTKNNVLKSMGFGGRQAVCILAPYFSFIQHIFIECLACARCHAQCRGHKWTRTTWPWLSHSPVGEAVNKEPMNSKLIIYCKKAMRDIHGVGP